MGLKGKRDRNRWFAGLAVVALVCAAMVTASPAAAADKKPNILVIMGDDIGTWNVSAYNQGMMGYRTPNIDRLAK
jgi:arylsulfatase